MGGWSFAALLIPRSISGLCAHRSPSFPCAHRPVNETASKTRDLLNGLGGNNGASALRKKEIEGGCDVAGSTYASSVE